MAKQEAIGLRVVTDGEYRRDFWNLDFIRKLEGVGLAPIAGVKFHAEDVPPMPTVTGRVRCAGPIMAEDFRFVRSIATAAPKLTIPAPAMLLRGGRARSPRAIRTSPRSGTTSRPRTAAIAHRRRRMHICGSTT